MASKPVILTCHGAWHTGACFNPLSEKLKEAGYQTISPTHLSCSHDPHPKPLQADSQHFRGIAMEIADQGKEIIALVHSYGGVVATNSLFDLGIEKRKKEGLKGGIKAIIYMCAFIPLKGESLFGTFGAETGNKAVDLPWITVNVCQSLHPETFTIIYKCWS
jgi:pimeloyl-ACP methyl ester carboxylesterase